MTQALAGGGAMAPAAPRLTAWRLATLVGSAGIFLIYSQFWVFPLLGDAGNPAASGLIRALYLPAYGVAALLLLLSPRATLLALLRQPFLLALLAICLASTLWSIAPDKTLTRVVALCFTTLGGVVLAARHRWASLLEILAAAFAFLTLVAIAVSVAVPSIGVMSELFPGAWRGVWPEKNALGGIMALGFIVLTAAAVLNPRRAVVWLPFAGLALLLVLMSTSKTSLVSLMLGLGGIAFVALIRRHPASGVATIWLAALAVAMIAGLFLFAADLFFEVLGKDATLTGRTKIWDAAMAQIRLRPWTGYGYGVIWESKGAWSPMSHIVKSAGFTPIHAHSAWIEQWIGLGVFGLAAFALMYVQTLMLAVVALFRDKGAYFAVPFLIVYTLMTLTESIAVTFHDFRWMMFVMVATKLVWPDREVRE
ncbi:O-antigen ligase family protein [Phenylobacterium sp. LjRoot164]|uniref:O-antigen ligase family protein n=1 Tax=unclassified Phenylobacterium TaxID=2640670 RepID=UPI003ECECC49